MDTEETATINAEATVPSDTTVAGKSLWRRLMKRISDMRLVKCVNGWPFTNFVKEFLNDHDLWIRMYAARGGASIVVLAGVLIASLVSLPFLAAVGGIIACSGLAALGLCATFVGGAHTWHRLKNIYSKTFPDLHLAEKPWVKKFLNCRAWKAASYLAGKPRAFFGRMAERPLVKKLLNSRAWKTASCLAKKSQDLFLTGMAGGGGIYMGALSTLTLVTQIALLPVVAIGGWFIFVTALATAGVVSSGICLYLTGQKGWHMLRDYRANKKAKAAEQGAASLPSPDPQPEPEAQQVFDSTVLTPDFVRAAEKKAEETSQDDPLSLLVPSKKEAVAAQGL